jgi:hypothetical protein
MINKMILAGACIAAMVSCHESQKASARITQIEQASDAYNKTLENQPSNKSVSDQVFAFVMGKDMDDRHRTWPESITVGKQYTAYVKKQVEDSALMLEPVTALIKGTVEDITKTPNDAKVGDCWFCKYGQWLPSHLPVESFYCVLTIQKIPPNTPMPPQTLQDGGYRSWRIVEGMSDGTVKTGSHGGPAPTE